MNAAIPTRPGFVTWMRACADAGGAHGSALIDRYADMTRGKRASFPSDADDDLLKAENLGWIVRGKLSPTTSQRAFLGLTYSKTIPESHASCWYWCMPNSTSPKYLEVMEWLKVREHELFGIYRCSKIGCQVMVRVPGTICTRTDSAH